MTEQRKPNTDKRKPVNDISFKISLNDEQKAAKAVILNNPVTVLRGNAGSGKTLLACQTALDQFFKREVNKVIITRPMVSKVDMGFLPGDIKEKMDPWLQPIYQNFYSLYGKEKVDKHIEAGDIQILPITFIRGITFVDSFVVVDEAQNLQHEEMEAVLGRLGKGSRLVICGDVAQIDLKDKKTSGFSFLQRVEEEVPGFKIITLKQNHRHEIVEPILQVYRQYS